uniref:Uncharacterized protein n=1 Tax=Lepeophtheirus salmonis TaxID=72036 RepID=A0A0K2VFG8_LEPSM
MGIQFVALINSAHFDVYKLFFLCILKDNIFQNFSFCDTSFTIVYLSGILHQFLVWNPNNLIVTLLIDYFFLQIIPINYFITTYCFIST